jgi:hypothetical protein
VIQKSCKERYSIDMELFLVALGLLFLVFVVFSYLEPPVAVILTIFFVFVLWKYMGENSVSFF